jgi:hypothetical protein
VCWAQVGTPARDVSEVTLNHLLLHAPSLSLFYLQADCVLPLLDVLGSKLSRPACIP